MTSQGSCDVGGLDLGKKNDVMDCCEWKKTVEICVADDHVVKRR